jgi:hypothetical protein
MSRFLSVGTLLLVALGTGACSSDEPATPKPGPARQFSPDALPDSGAAIYLRQKQLEPDQLVLELVGRALPDTYGVAWRLRYDPSVLALAGSRPSSVWSSSHVHMAREPHPGLLVGVVGAKGNQSGVEATDTPLAELSFKRNAPGRCSVDFVIERSAVVHSDGRHAQNVSWIGGKLSD